MCEGVRRRGGGGEKGEGKEVRNTQIIGLSRIN